MAVLYTVSIGMGVVTSTWNNVHVHWQYSKTCVKWPLSKRPKNGFQDRLSLNAGQKYCKMLQREHSAILSTFIKLPVGINTFVLFIFEWQFYTGFTVNSKQLQLSNKSRRKSLIISLSLHHSPILWVSKRIISISLELWIPDILWQNKWNMTNVTVTYIYFEI